MTEEEWNSDPPLGAMLHYINGIAGPRKWRLFALACCQRVHHVVVDDRSKSALAGLELYIEGRLDPDQLVALNALAKAASDAIGEPYIHGAIHANAESLAACAVHSATNPDEGPASRSYATSSTISAAFYARSVISDPVYKRTNSPEEAEAAYLAEGNAQIDFLRDIFGNPFRPVSADPSWLTSDVLALARGIYDDRAFDRMPILADALQDAGCTNEEVLAHCRATQLPHVRGCWVVDLLLGKS